ncbi:MAG: DegV family protein [Clostridiales bacterium]|nr:DegV family protein [Clostridiales bacterium]
MLVLFTDTDTDITPAVAKEYGYNLISMPYAVDGNTVYPYVDFDEFDYHAFYDTLRAGTLPTTSAISEDAYINYFEPHFANGNDILYVHFSAAMTATFDSMNKAVASLLEKYPERKFYAVDTKGITIVSYNIVREIGDLYKSGKSAEEIVEWAKTEVDKFAIYFFADDLKFFRRSGRVSGLAATMGTLIGIRPIIYMNDEGKMVSIGKETGRMKALARLISYVDELGDDIKSHRIIIGHTDSLEIAEQVGQMLKEKYGDDLNIEYVVTNPTAGSHCGPNGVGICFHAKHR